MEKWVIFWNAPKKTNKKASPFSQIPVRWTSDPQRCRPPTIPCFLLSRFVPHLRSWHWRRCPHRSRSCWPPWQLPRRNGYRDWNRGREDVSRTLRPNVHLPRVHAGVKAGADKLGKLLSTIIFLFATYIVTHNIVIVSNLSVKLADGFKISLTYLHQYNYMLLHCDYDSLQPADCE